MLGDLSRQFESGDNGPGTIGRTDGDAGGASYGTYQLSSAAGSVQNFIGWMLDRPKYADFAQRLLAVEVASESFDSIWQSIASDFTAGFSEAQHSFIEATYYEPAKESLLDIGYDIDKHSEGIRQVVWSAAVQYGPGYVPELFTTAAANLGYPNLSYVDAANFDSEMIDAIYMVRASDEWTAGSPSLRPGLRARFAEECRDAQAMV